MFYFVIYSKRRIQYGVVCSLGMNIKEKRRRKKKCLVCLTNDNFLFFAQTNCLLRREEKNKRSF